MTNTERTLSAFVVASMIGGSVLTPRVACAQATPATPAPAAAAPVAPNAPGANRLDEAKTHYDRGLQLFGDEAYEAALKEFERANQLAPNYKILYNIGLIYRQLNNYVAAIESLEKYLDAGGTQIAEARQAEVKKVLAQVKPLVATVQVASKTAGADVAIDDAPHGKTPLKKEIVLNPGRRKITLTKVGYLPSTKFIDVVGSDAVHVDIELVSLGVPGAAVATNPWTVRAYVGWGVTGALAVGAGVTGILAISSSNRLDDLKTQPQPTTRSELDSQQSEVKTFSLVSDVLTATTVVAAGVSTYFTYRAIKFGNASKEKENSTTPHASLDILPGAASFHGTF